MATKTQYLTYYIVLTDPVLVKQYQETVWHTDVNGEPVAAGVINRAPYNPGPPEGGAAIEFAAPLIPARQKVAASAPYIYSDWLQRSIQYPFPTNAATFTRSVGGFLGITALGGTTTRFFWMGQFVLATDPDGDTVDGAAIPEAARALIPLRRWIEGFEHPGGGTLGTTTGLAVSADAARHPGGYGLAQRGASNVMITRAVNSYDGGAISRPKSWERLYVRLRALPNITTQCWSMTTLPSPTSGQALSVTPDGQLVLMQVEGAVQTLRGVVGTLEVWTGRADHHAWVRVDLLLDTLAGTCRVYRNGVLALAAGLVVATGHGASRVGNAVTQANTLQIDLDDWMNANIPVGDDTVINLLGRDWLNGSKIALVRPTVFAGAHVGWTGNVRTLLQRMHTAGTFLGSSLTSTTALATIAAQTDAAAVADQDPGAIGTAAILVTVVGTRGTSSGTLGYGLAGAAAVLQPIAQTVAIAGQGVLYPGAGLKTLPGITPLEILHQKGNDVSASSVYALLAQVELIGIFGPEDVRVSELDDADLPASPDGLGTHNTPYPRSPWTRRGAAAPIAPYILHSGTYVGNGTGTDLLFRAPVHMCYIRPVVTGGGLYWISSLLAGHATYQEGLQPDAIGGDENPDFVGADLDDTQQQQYRIRLPGSHAQCNANGLTYQYVAVMDPGMRFTLNQHAAPMVGEVAHVRALTHPTFTPEFIFLFTESMTGITLVRLYFKGPGQALTDTLSSLSSFGSTNNALTLGTGEVTTRTEFHAFTSLALACWRRQDGNLAAGEQDVVAIGTYTGDGAGSRTIGVGSGTTKRPLWALVDGETGSGVMRDPAHTGVNSLQGGATNIVTGITAGQVDGFTVGSSLNTSAVIYNYFVLWGSATPGNNGWSIDGEFLPVDPTSPADGPWPLLDEEVFGDPPDALPPPVGSDPWAGVGAPPTSASEFTECPEWATYAVNVALTRIGVSKQLANVVTDVSEEASVARLTFGTDVDTTLRDFPWPFATKYAALFRTAGTVDAGVNADWRYAYRRPADCVFERRIVLARNGSVDPTPPPFASGRDALGPVLFCNVADAVLEYTARPLCVVSAGDVLFRDALIWRLAATLAAPLTRMGDRALQCLEAYKIALVMAESVHKPGTPGIPQTLTDAQAAEKRDVVNRALLRIGARTILHYLTDQSRDATAARAVFELEYESVLRDFPWAFATQYAALVVVGGTAATRLNDDWHYSYRLPADHVATRRLVTATGRGFDPTPARFKLGRDVTGGLLYTDELTPMLEYTARVTLEDTDGLFRDALAWRLAHTLAPSLGQVEPLSPEQLGRGPDAHAHINPGWRATRPDETAAARQRLADRAWQYYQLTLRAAKTVDANEQQQSPGGDANWITGR